MSKYKQKSKRTRSEGPPNQQNRVIKPMADVPSDDDAASEDNLKLTNRKRGRHGQMIDLMTA